MVYLGSTGWTGNTGGNMNDRDKEGIDCLELRIKQANKIIRDRQDELNYLVNKVEELQAKNAKLRECVKYYAEYSNWRKEFGNTQEYNAHRIKDDFTLDANFTPYGGKRARAVLKELDEE